MAAIRATFVVFGMFWGVWAVAAFDVQRFLDISDGGLGALLGLTVGAAALANAAGGHMAERFGAVPTLRVSLVVWGLGGLVTAATRDEIPFVGAFLVTVAVGGLVDVAMNIAGSQALDAAGDRLLRLHAHFNGGALLGAAATGILLAIDLSWRWSWAAIGALALMLTITARYPADRPASARRPSEAGPQRTLRGSGLGAVAVAFTLGAFVEGAVDTWGVLFLRAELGLAALGGAFAFVAGQGLATGARVSLGRIAGGLGELRTARLGLTIAASGLVLQALSPVALLAAAGLALAAVGVAATWPVLVAIGGSHARPEVAVGVLTASGYVGLLAGPPVVGLVADAASLRIGLVVLAVVAAFAAAVPLRMVRRPPHGVLLQAGACQPDVTG